MKQFAYKNAFYDPNPAFMNKGFSLQGKGIHVEEMPLVLSPDKKEVIEQIVEDKQSGMADLNKMSF